MTPPDDSKSVARLYQRGDDLPAEWWRYEGEGEISVTFGGPTKVEQIGRDFHAEALEPGSPYIRIDSKGEPIDGGVLRWLVPCEWRGNTSHLWTFPQ